MGIFDRFSSKKVTVPTPITVEKKSTPTLSAFNLNVDYSTMGYQDLMRGARGYLFGQDGLYPNELNQFVKKSPLHSAILNMKRLLTTGNGYEIEGQELLSVKDKITLNQLTSQFDNLINEVAMDLFIHSRICLKITWNADNTKILKVKRISPDKIRIDEVDEEMEPLSFFYNWDWVYPTKYSTLKYAKFDQANKKDKVQLLQYQVESAGMRLYAEPTYQSALNWIILDAEMSSYHRANIVNSVNPSMLIQFYYEPETIEEQQAIIRGIRSSFAGSEKTGRLMTTFSPDKDSAPTVTQMEPNKLDGTFITLTDTIQRQILYAHQISPDLLGLKTPGSLGNSGEFIYSFNMFNQQIILPSQRIIEGILNDIIAINGLAVKICFAEPDASVLNPALSEVTAQSVKAEEMAAEQSRTAVNDTLRKITGREHQQLLRIMKQYGQGKLTYDQAAVMLSTSYGMTDDEIKMMLVDSED